MQLPAAAPSPATVESAQVAGFWHRLAAILIDYLVLAVWMLLIGFALFRWLASLGQAGRIIGFAAALLYFGVLNSRLGAGQTLGKRLMGIRVVDQVGGMLSPGRSVIRFLVIALPFFLNGFWFDLDAASAGFPQYLLGAALAMIVFGGGGAIVYLLIFNRRTRQSLHDLVVGSFVVRASAPAAPITISTARFHLIVVGCWLAVSLVAPGVGIYVIQRSGLLQVFKPLEELQTEIKRQPGVRQAKVTIGTTTLMGPRGGTTTSYLQVDVEANVAREDLAALDLMVARAVLDLHRDLLGKQVLVVVVRRGFDLGIASWTESHRESHDAAAWRQKLNEFRASPGKA